MKNETASNNLKKKLTNSVWWMGVAGNILSTVLGIVLTLGIAALVDNNNDKKIAREMMFDIINTAEDQITAMQEIDSIATVEREGARQLLLFYLDNNGDLSKISPDTICYYLNQSMVAAKTIYWTSSTDSYFYNAQLLHQFKNPEVYNYFASYIQFNKSIVQKINELNYDAIELSDKVHSWKYSHMLDQTPSAQVKEFIEDKTLTDYFTKLRRSNFKKNIRTYEQFRDGMLMQMDATYEDLLEYRKQNALINEEEVTQFH